MKKRMMCFPILIAFIVIGLVFLSCAAQYQKATVRSTPPLDYPLQAQMQEREGVASVAVYVGGDSSVKTVELEKSSGYVDLDSVAMSFARQVEFNPANKDGEPIPSWTRLSVNFRLDRTSNAQGQRLEKFKAYHKQIASFENEEKRNTALEALYKLSTNVLGSTSLDSDVKINDKLREVVSKKVYEYWQPLKDNIPLTFVLMDDYLYRYPDSPRYSDAKLRLIEYFDMLENDLGQVELHEGKAKNNEKIIELIDKRKKQLKNESVSSVL